MTTPLSVLLEFSQFLREELLSLLLTDLNSDTEITSGIPVEFVVDKQPVTVPYGTAGNA